MAIEVPGQRGRQLEDWADGAEDVMRQTHILATHAGVVEIEFGYQVEDRPVLAADQEPLKTDRVTWFFTGMRAITLAGRRAPVGVAVRGEFTVEPGAMPHAVGCAYAAKRFLEQCGVTVELRDVGI